MCAPKTLPLGGKIVLFALYFQTLLQYKGPLQFALIIFNCTSGMNIFFTVKESGQ